MHVGGSEVAERRALLAPHLLLDGHILGDVLAQPRRVLVRRASAVDEFRQDGEASLARHDDGSLLLGDVVFLGANRLGVRRAALPQDVLIRFSLQLLHF